MIDAFNSISTGTNLHSNKIHITVMFLLFLSCQMGCNVSIFLVSTADFSIVYH